MKHDTTTPPPQRPSIHLNWEDWLPYLDDTTASDTEKRALIETLWTIVQGFVDLSWEVGPSQETSGQPVDLTALLRAAVLYSKDQHKEEV